MINIITAASSNHFKTLCQFLRSVPIEYNTFVYDIGLTQEQSIEIQNMFPNIKYRIFNFSLYPTFINLSSQDAGAYAWKPIIISDVYKETEGVLIWCDAGTIITDVNKLRKNAWAPMVVTALGIVTVFNLLSRKALSLIVRLVLG